MPRFHVQKRQHEYFADALQREDAIGEKVALPERRNVLLKKFIPRSFAPLRTRFVASVLEDAFDRALGNGADTQLLKLAEVAGVAPLLFFGLLEDQKPDLVRRAAKAAFGRLLLPVILLGSNLLQVGGGGLDGCQFPQPPIRPVSPVVL